MGVVAASGNTIGLNAGCRKPGRLSYSIPRDIARDGPELARFCASSY
jgi:hypothetical protein